MQAQLIEARSIVPIAGNKGNTLPLDRDGNQIPVEYIARMFPNGCMVAGRDPKKDSAKSWRADHLRCCCSQREARALASDISPSLMVAARSDFAVVLRVSPASSARRSHM